MFEPNLNDRITRPGASPVADRGRLEHLLRKYEPVLLGRIRSMMGARARATLESTDVLQETLTDIFEGFPWPDAVDDGRFLRWASAIARNNLLAGLRRQRPALLESASGCLDSATPSRDAMRRDLDMVVRRAIESMPPDQRRVIELRDLRQLPFTAVAREMARSSNAVQLLHTRAMTRLGRLLRERLDDRRAPSGADDRLGLSR